MRKRALLAAALVAMVVALAGCGALFGGGAGGDGGADESADGTLTAAPVPEVTATPERWPVAPGLSGSGVADVDALVAAHLEAVSKRSYTWREFRGSATVFAADEGTDGGADGSGTASDPVGTAGGNDTASTPVGTPEVRVFPTSIARVESPRTYVAWTDSDWIRIGGTITYVANYSEFADGERLYRRYRFPGNAEPIVEQGNPVDAGYNEIVGEAAESAIRRYLTAEDATVAAIDVDGNPHYEVLARGRSSLGANGTRDFRARAVVSPEGFVRSLNVSFVEVSADVRRHVRYRFVYEKVNETSVDPPGWIADRRR